MYIAGLVGQSLSGQTLNQFLCRVDLGLSCCLLEPTGEDGEVSIHTCLTMTLNEIMKDSTEMVVLGKMVQDCGLELRAVKVSALISPD